MKQLADGTEVSSRSYYYLLEYNDRDEWKTIDSLYGICKLSELNKEQYWNLFHVLTKKELEANNYRP